MCDFHVLHHDGRGYVAHCAGCRRVQAAFGNVVLSLTQEEFEALAKRIAVREEEHAHCRDCPVKDIYLHTPAENMLFVFSGKELLALHEMLEQSRLLLEVKALLGG